MAKKEAEKTVIVKKRYGGGGGTVYGVGLIGALVYYISNAVHVIRKREATTKN